MDDSEHKYGDLDLEEIVEGLLNNQVSKERMMKMYTGCATYGSRNLMNEPPCDNPECNPCSMFKKGIESEAKKYGKS